MVLLRPWQEVARWFWDTLVDADLANNTLGWQWVAGSGADAAPYHRIFNPAPHAERVHPHRPPHPRFSAPAPRAARFHPGGAYSARWLGDGPRPEPIVDHAAARRRALDAF